MFQGTLICRKRSFNGNRILHSGTVMQDVTCKETRFGPHTRFHRSVFRGAVDCTAALFDGMTEFLEVTFEQPVTMKQVRFGSGTGFSGKPIRASQAIFARQSLAAIRSSDLRSLRATCLISRRDSRKRGFFRCGIQARGRSRQGPIRSPATVHSEPNGQTQEQAKGHSIPGRTVHRDLVFSAPGRPIGGLRDQMK